MAKIIDLATFEPRDPRKRLKWNRRRLALAVALVCGLPFTVGATQALWSQGTKPLDLA